MGGVHGEEAVEWARRQQAYEPPFADAHNPTDALSAIAAGVALGAALERGPAVTVTIDGQPTSA